MPDSTVSVRHEEKEKRAMKRAMDRRVIDIPMSESEILILHGSSVFWDGRNWVTKLIRKRIRPIALRLLKERGPEK